jgi:hypothetical protein
MQKSRIFSMGCSAGVVFTFSSRRATSQSSELNCSIVETWPAQLDELRARPTSDTVPESSQALHGEAMAAPV